jgi:hypothetical protein
LSWFSHRMKDRDLVLVFYTWTSSFPSIICWGRHLFPNICFWQLCQESEGSSCSGLFLGSLFYFIGLWLCFCVNTRLFLLPYLCSKIWNQVLWYPQDCSFHSDCFDFSVSFVPPCEFFDIFFYFCEEYHWNLKRIDMNL